MIKFKAVDSNGATTAMGEASSDGKWYGWVEGASGLITAASPDQILDLAIRYHGLNPNEHGWTAIHRIILDDDDAKSVSPTLLQARDLLHLTHDD